MDRIGLVGLGAMGLHMARNIMKAGHALTVYDIRTEAMENIERVGALTACTLKDLGQKANLVLLMVQNFQQCENCLLGPEGLLAGLKEGVVIITSTVSPDEVRKLAAYCKEKGIDLLDSPVSGGTRGAAEASLTIMSAGKDEIYQRCVPILHCIGANLVKVGNEIGQGQAIKAVNQLLVGVHMVAMAEAMVLGAKSGLDPQIVYDVVKNSAGNSRIFENRVPALMDRDFSTRSTLAIQFKDTDISVRAADSVKAPVFLAPICRELFKIAEAKGVSSEDSSAIVKLYEELAGVMVKRTEKITGSI